MSGTDVAPKQAEEHAGEEPEFKQTSPVLAFLKIWLPFPIILGGILFWQFESGRLEPPPKEEVVTDEVVFEGAGAELPMLLQSLQEERDLLRKEWADVALARERLLLEAGEIDAQQQEVDDLLARVEAKVQVMEEERDAMLGQLARVYDTMKADAAAGILAGIDVETSTEILRRMRERSAAQVMASLEPKAAARISQRMLRTP